MRLRPRQLWHTPGILLLWLLVACVGDDQESVVSDFELEGSVRDDLSGKPISGAAVTFVSDTLDRTESHSDGDGRFYMVVEVRAGVAHGILRAEHPDYEPSSERSVYFDGTERTVELQLRRTGD